MAQNQLVGAMIQSQKSIELIFKLARDRLEIDLLTSMHHKNTLAKALQ